MEIKPGNYYMTRDGRKAYVGHVAPEEFGYHSRLIGHVLDRGTWGACSWTLSGEFMPPRSCEDDLVSVWVEPDPDQCDDLNEARNAFIKAFVKFVDSQHAEFNYEIDVFGDEYEYYFEVYIDNTTCVTVNIRELFDAYELKHYGRVGSQQPEAEQ